MNPNNVHCWRVCVLPTFVHLVPIEYIAEKVPPPIHKL